jgi:hypothetical protein
MEDPVLLVLCDSVRNIDLRYASHLWLARTNGFRPVLANWRDVRVGRRGTAVSNAVEVTPELRLRRRDREITVAPSVVLHRKLLWNRSEQLIERLAEAHPGAILSYGAPWRLISRKWTGEALFRDGERKGIVVPRPSTYLVAKADIGSKLHDVGRAHSLIFKPSTGSQCHGIWLSTPRSFNVVAERLRRGRRGAYVAQDLVPNPVLYDGKKVDLRLYVLVTSFRPLRMKLYREGVVRIAARRYRDAADDPALAELTGCCYRRRRRQVIENIPVAALLERLRAEGFPTDAFWSDAEQVLFNAFRCLGAYGGMEHVPHLDRRYYLGGVDLLLADCGDVLRPLFIETNYVPQLNGWGRQADHSLRETHGQWLRDLRTLALERAA